MTTAFWKADRATFFYLAMGWIAVGASVAGFSTTYFLPLSASRFEGPVVAHVHGLLFFVWVALLTVQALLVRANRSRLHRKLGLVALPLAFAMAASGVGVGLYAVRRDLTAGMGDVAYSMLIGVLAAMAIFLAYVCIAIAMRERPDWHKRMMLLATIAVLWPAWFRFRHFMTWLPNPEFWLAIVLADSLIVLAAVRDKLVCGRVHPAYWIFGSALAAEHVLELLLFDSAPWRATARAIYSTLV